jgi:hypothetical protein
MIEQLDEEGVAVDTKVPRIRKSHDPRRLYALLISGTLKFEGRSAGIGRRVLRI